MDVKWTKTVPVFDIEQGDRASDLVSLKTCATLTGIEPAGYQFSSVQLGLSSCVFGLVQFATRAFRAVWMADVLPRCCPGAAPRPGFGCSRSPIPLRAGNPMLADRPGIGIFLVRVIQPPPTTGNGALWISVHNAVYNADCH